MQIVLQRVAAARVTVDGEECGAIGAGYALLLGVEKGDDEAKAAWLADKILRLRLFAGEGGKINDRSVLEIGGGILVVSQFTLCGSVEGGNRPDYTAAAERGEAERLYDRFREMLRERGAATVQGGLFGAHMQLTLTNDGPVTLLLRR